MAISVRNLKEELPDSVIGELALEFKKGKKSPRNGQARLSLQESKWASERTHHERRVGQNKLHEMRISLDQTDDFI